MLEFERHRIDEELSELATFDDMDELERTVIEFSKCRDYEPVSARYDIRRRRERLEEEGEASRDEYQFSGWSPPRTMTTNEIRTIFAALRSGD